MGAGRDLPLPGGGAVKRAGSRAADEVPVLLPVGPEFIASGNNAAAAGLVTQETGRFRAAVPEAGAARGVAPLGAISFASRCICTGAALPLDEVPSPVTARLPGVTEDALEPPASHGGIVSSGPICKAADPNGPPPPPSRNAPEFPAFVPVFLGQGRHPPLFQGDSCGFG